MQATSRKYDVTYYLPDGWNDAFPTEGENSVAVVFRQLYSKARTQTGQAAGEELVVVLKLEGFPLGAFVLPFVEETAPMQETTVAAFSQQLWQDWLQAFRIFPLGMFNRLGNFLASAAGHQ